MSKVKSGKETVTVSFAWFSQSPTFDEALKAVNHELAEKNIITLPAARAINKLLPLNGGQPFKGHTEFGPHTFISYEAATLADAVESFKWLRELLWQLFPPKGFTVNFLATVPKFAGITLETLIREMENTLVKTEKEIKETRSIFPNKSLQSIRLDIEKTINLIRG